MTGEAVRATPAQERVLSLPTAVAWWLFMLVSTAFVATAVFIIIREGIYIPYGDQWGWLRRYYAPDEPLARLLLRPINGHIVLLPALVYTVDIAFTAASNAFNMFALLTILIATCGVLWRGALQVPGTRSRTAAAFGALALMLTFWLHHWENLFWPFQLHQCLSVLLAVAGLLMLARAVLLRDPGRGAIPALLTGLGASLSFGVGLAFWPAAAALVMLGTWPRAWKLRVVAAALATMVAVAAYTVVFAPRAVALEKHTPTLLDVVNFIPMYLGGPLYVGGNMRVLQPAETVLLPIIAGYVGIALAIVAFLRIRVLHRQRSLSVGTTFFAGVVVFILVTSLMALVTRSGSGMPAIALSSRYGYYSELFWLSLLVLLASTAKHPPAMGHPAVQLGACATVVLLVATQFAYLDWWLGWRTHVAWARASLSSGVPDRQYLGWIFPPHRPEFVEHATGTFIAHRVTRISHDRATIIGHPVTEFGPPDSRCAGRVTATKALAAGSRVEGSVALTPQPFAVRRVYVVDATERVVGLGEVERVWRGFDALGREADLTWTAYVPAAAAGASTVYVETDGGLCKVPLQRSRL